MLRYPVRFRKWSSEDQWKLDQIKRELAHNLDRAANRLGLTQKELAIILGTHQCRISHALGGDLSKVTVNQLIRYLIMLEPYFRIQVAI